MTTTPTGAAEQPEALYADAVKFAKEKASIAYVQRKCRCSFNNAERMLERMVRDGIIETYRGRKAAAQVEALSAAQPEALKDHQIAALVNELGDIAVKYHDTQQLRERIAHAVVPLAKATQAGTAAQQVTPHEVATQPTALSMTLPAERSLFKEQFRHLDLEEIPDAWGRPVFKHSHVDAIWNGWRQRAAVALLDTHTRPCPTARAAPAAPLNTETQDQIAAVMLQHGTEDQQRAALAYASAAPAAQADSQPPQCPYSIDADPQGIRAMVADAITGALGFGAQGTNPPPSGHWLAPFWNAARADRSQADSALKDAALLDWQASERVEVSPEYEGPWHAAVFGEDEKPVFLASGNTPREALIAARKQGGAT